MYDQVLVRLLLISRSSHLLFRESPATETGMYPIIRKTFAIWVKVLWSHRVLLVGALTQQQGCSSVNGCKQEWNQKPWVSHASKTLSESSWLLLEHLFSENWQGYWSYYHLTAFVLWALCWLQALPVCSKHVVVVFIPCELYCSFLCDYSLLSYPSCFHHPLHQKP